MKRRISLTAFIFLIFLGNALSQTVYITKSGKKYHTENCRYLSNSSIAIDLSEASSKRYTPLQSKTKGFMDKKKAEVKLITPANLRPLESRDTNGLPLKNDPRDHSSQDIINY